MVLSLKAVSNLLKVADTSPKIAIEREDPQTRSAPSSQGTEGMSRSVVPPQTSMTTRPVRVLLSVELVEFSIAGRIVRGRAVVRFGTGSNNKPGAGDRLLVVPI